MPFVELGFFIRHNVWFAFLLCPLVLWTALTRRSRWARTACYALWCLTFILSLLGTWQHAVTDSATIRGLIPLNDSGEYYTSARRLVEGYRFLDIASSRPLATGFLSFVLWLTHGNYQVTLLLFALVCSLACCLFVYECGKSLGKAAAVCAGTLVFVFYSRFIGTAGTEELGLTFALLATALLLKGSRCAHLPSAVFGLFLLALALITRAGALLVLPALTLWVALTFKTAAGRVCWRHVSTATVTIVLAFSVNSVLVRAVASGEQPAFGNFSFSLYGLVTGGKGWTHVRAVHPELLKMPFNAQCREIYSLAWQAFRRRPDLTVVGAARYLGEFVKPTGFGMFGFVLAHRFTYVKPWGFERVFNVGSRIVLLLLAVWGTRCCWRHRRHPTGALLLAATAGTLASVPFVPPIDTDQSRAYAATIPFLAVVTSFGVEAAFGRLRRIAVVLPSAPGSRGWRHVAVFGMALAFAAFGGPILVKSLAAATTVIPTVCPEGQSARYVRMSRATGVRLEGTSFIDVLDVVQGTRVFLVLPDALNDRAWRHDEIAAVCGVPDAEFGYPVLAGRSIRPATVVPAD